MPVRNCGDDDFAEVYAIVNDAAQAYKGIIPADRWKEPYMPEAELDHEMAHGVRFLGYEVATSLVGVMGVQRVDDVHLIRHAYVRTAQQGSGIGSALLAAIREQVDTPLLVGTWAAATWAIAFYERHGFRLTTPDQKTALLRRYWTIPERQIETSVVLADERWFESQRGAG